MDCRDNNLASWKEGCRLRVRMTYEVSLRLISRDVSKGSPILATSRIKTNRFVGARVLRLLALAGFVRYIVIF